MGCTLCSANQLKDEEFVVMERAVGHGSTESCFVTMRRLDFDKRYKHLNDAKKQQIQNFVANDCHKLCLRPDELCRLRKMFDKHHDLKDSKSMSKEIFLTLVQLDIGTHAEEGDMLDLVFQCFDQDNNGSLSFREFVLGFSFWKRELASAKSKLYFLFVLFDVDQSHHLDRAEFKHMILHFLSGDAREATHEQESKSIHWVKECFGEADADGNDVVLPDFRQCSLFCGCAGNGLLSPEEFQSWVAQKHGSETLVLGGVEYPSSIIETALALNIEGAELNQDQFLDLLNRTLDFDVVVGADLETQAEEITERVFFCVDADANGTIDFAEFEKWLDDNTRESQEGVNHESEDVRALFRKSRDGKRGIFHENVSLDVGRQSEDEVVLQSKKPALGNFSVPFGSFRGSVGGEKRQGGSYREKKASSRSSMDSTDLRVYRESQECL